MLFIDTLDFERFPPGGTLNFARQMLLAFGDRLCLVGVVTDDTPVGRWVDKQINGLTYKFFAIGRYTMTASKPFIPPRLTGYLQLRRYRKEIMSLGITSAFTQSHEVIMATSGWEWNNLCFRFPGAENPLSISRYSGANLLSGLFDRMFFPAVRRADVIMAAADEKSIKEMITRSNGAISRAQVVQFPTRVDTSIFHPASTLECRADVGFPEDATVIVTCGRVHWAKGWKFLIDAFCIFRQSHTNAYLCFIGDGQDRGKVEEYAKETGTDDRVRITGTQTPQQVAKYINAADLFVFGSYREGWATVLIEALSCGIPIVSTNVSSAGEIITEGRNGYVVEDRDTEKFAEAMRKAITLENSAELSLAKSQKYALKYLARDLEKIFPPLKA